MTYTNDPKHGLTYVEDITYETTCKVDDNGNLELVGKGQPIEVQETSIWCDTCGRLGEDEYEDHGISDDWQVV